MRNYEIKLEDVEASHTHDGALTVATALVIAVPESAHSEYMASLRETEEVETRKQPVLLHFRNIICVILCVIVYLITRNQKYFSTDISNVKNQLAPSSSRVSVTYS